MRCWLWSELEAGQPQQQQQQQELTEQQQLRQQQQLEENFKIHFQTLLATVDLATATIIFVFFFVNARTPLHNTFLHTHTHSIPKTILVFYGIYTLAEGILILVRSLLGTLGRHLRLYIKWMSINTEVDLGMSVCLFKVPQFYRYFYKSWYINFLLPNAVYTSERGGSEQYIV